MDLNYCIELPPRVILEELSDFQPQVELRDVYKFKETAINLPDKENELERIRRQKALDSNIMEHIKVESFTHEEEKRTTDHYKV